MMLFIVNLGPTSSPTTDPTSFPTSPTMDPTESPTREPTTDPTTDPTSAPTTAPTPYPTVFVDGYWDDDFVYVDKSSVTDSSSTGIYGDGWYVKYIVFAL